MWSHVALYKYLRYQWFNLQLLEATSTTHLTSRICHGCVYKGIKLCTLLSCTILAVLHRPVETASLHIELVSLFSKFSSLGSVYFFFHTEVFIYVSLMRRFANSRSVFFLCYCLWVEDCLKLQHYCPDIDENFHLRFINCKDWTIIFFQFTFSLTILCTIKIWLSKSERVLKRSISSHMWDWDGLGRKKPCG